jgi:hypothetical protein
MKVTGRFFWFKRATDWFVWMCASTEDNGSGDEVQELLDAAFDERALRRKQKSRTK